MSLHTVSEAARLAGVSRPTIYKALKSGKLSSTLDDDGKPQIDTSELIRVYGELRSVDNPEPVTNDTGNQVALQVAQARLEAADETIRLLRDQLGKAEEREAKGLEIIARQTLLLAAPKPEAAPPEEVQPARTAANDDGTRLERALEAAENAPGEAGQVARVREQPPERRSLWQRITGR